MDEYRRGTRPPYWIDRNNNIRKAETDVSAIVMELTANGKKEDVDCIKQLLVRGAHFDSLVHELRRVQNFCGELDVEIIDNLLKEVGAD